MQHAAVRAAWFCALQAEWRAEQELGLATALLAAGCSALPVTSTNQLPTTLLFLRSSAPLLLCFSAPLLYTTTDSHNSHLHPEQRRSARVVSNRASLPRTADCARRHGRASAAMRVRRAMGLAGTSLSLSWSQVSDPFSDVQEQPTRCQWVLGVHRCDALTGSVLSTIDDDIVEAVDDFAALLTVLGSSKQNRFWGV